MWVTSPASTPVPLLATASLSSYAHVTLGATRLLRGTTYTRPGLRCFGVVCQDTHQSPIRIKAHGRVLVEEPGPAPGSSEPQKTVGSRPRPIAVGRLRANARMDSSVATNLPVRSKPFVAHGRGVSIRTALSRGFYVDGWDSVQSGLMVANQPHVGLAAPAKKVSAPHLKALVTSKATWSRRM